MLFRKKLPIKRVVVAGNRNYDNYCEAKEFIDECLSPFKNKSEIIIVSGGARGADRLGEMYAEENGYKIEVFSADWGKYGKSAGPRRNREMAMIADLVICFWDGKSRGTKSMIAFSEELKKPLMVKNIQIDDE